VVSGYSTNFSLAENPISDGGAWITSLANATDVISASGIATGTQTGTGGFNDSIAFLSGAWGNNYQCSAVVYRDPSFAPSTTREVELLLSATFNTGDTQYRGYECTFSWDGAYMQIVRIRPEDGGFVYLVGTGGGGNAGPAAGVQNGDVVKATYINGVITAYHAPAATPTVFTQYAQVTDTLCPRGAPGIGFWRGGVGSGTDTNAMFGFDSYSAQGLP